MVQDALQISIPLLLVIGGIALIAAEALAPGAHFIVLGVALLFAGLLGLLLPPLAGPIVLAFLVLIIGALSLYIYREFDFYGGKGSARTSDSSSLTGSTGYVVNRVTQTRGRVKLDDGGFNPMYEARALNEEIPEDERVMVVDPGGGNVVTVELLSDIEDSIDRELAQERDTNE